MRLVFIHGPVASGKLTIARALAGITGYAVFHNHLVVDAVAAVFPFGWPEFVRLREKMWLDVMREAALARRSLVFTFAPEPTVVQGFAERAAQAVRAGGGTTHFVQQTVPTRVQEERLTAPSRAEFGKLRSVALLLSCAHSSKPPSGRCPKATWSSTLRSSGLRRQPARSSTRWGSPAPEPKL